MSRIGKKPIAVAAGVRVAIDGRAVEVKGAKGTLGLRLPEGISVRQEGGQLAVTCAPGLKKGGALHGTMRTLIANMVRGVSEGYEKTLQVVGVGYKIKVEGDTLTLQLGYSHPIEFPIPAGISIVPGKENTLTVSGCDKQAVGQVAATIRGFAPPEPYKGKGIRYRDERVRRKAGKAVAAAS
ncbi:MAG: 50S ribosomal protein L6 [bacterium]|nr:50S ribosomal protein L6 [bacterium]